MDPEPPRRRPRAPPPAAPGEAPAPPPPATSAAPGRNPFSLVIGVALVVVGGVIAVAFATGTGEDLPWGAIIGVVAVLALAYVAGRRRQRMVRGDEGDGA